MKFIARYGLAILSVGACFWIRQITFPILGSLAPMLVFVAGVVVSAWYGGLLPGILATALSAAVGSVYMLEPFGQLAIADRHDWIGLFIFLFIGLLISLLSESLHASFRRLQSALSREREARQALEATTQALTASESHYREVAECLARSEQRVKSIVDHVVDGIITIDNQGRIESWNRAAEQIFGYRADEVTGKNVKMLMPENDRSQHDLYLNNYIRTGEKKIIGKGREVVGLRKDGSEFPVDLAISEFWIGSKQFFTGIVRDITDRVRVAEDLREAKEEAEAASRAKSQFVANVSHEIRTPLGVIIGFGDLALEEELLEAKNRHIETINRSSRQLLQLIDELLDLSKVEADRLAVEKIPVRLTELLDDIRSTLGFKAREKGIHMTIESDGPVPRELQSDPTRLRQILTNVIGNAIKFTEKGGVNVRIQSRLPDHPQKPVLVDFIVSDTGIGISHSDREKLFRPFVQADNSTTRKFGGTGLGLALSRRIAQALGGDLTLDWSEPGQGSRFTVTVQNGPLETDSFQTVDRQDFSDQEALQTQGLPPPQLNAVRVLLVEDSRDNRVLVTRILRNAGAEIDTADNGAEGMDKALNQDFDVVVMDLQMPVMDGFEATRQLRQAGYRKPIVALTAHAMKGEREKALDNGFSEYLTKPVDRRQLILRISQLAGSSQGTDATS